MYMQTLPHQIFWCQISGIENALEIDLIYFHEDIDHI